MKLSSEINSNDKLGAILLPDNRKLDKDWLVQSINAWRKCSGLAFCSILTWSLDPTLLLAKISSGSDRMVVEIDPFNQSSTASDYFTPVHGRKTNRKNYKRQLTWYPVTRPAGNESSASHCTLHIVFPTNWMFDLFTSFGRLRWVIT